METVATDIIEKRRALPVWLTTLVVAILAFMGAVLIMELRLRALVRAVEAGNANLEAIRDEARASAEEAARTTAAVRDLTRAVNPKYDHVVCPAHDGKHEVDLGVPAPCPNPDDGQCVHGDMPISVAQARCAAGKL